ncbi:uncharacterized protein J3D65DRAFT_586721 [Phyllosticta citribraziliensis]|uniref:Zn(2)-C6 fungal-type domain-containing protein n=1 Tax=Phyllosticta citribraziliensis TaxID=989973 RepID=A0ABR1LWY5_9PEZI
MASAGPATSLASSASPDKKDLSDPSSKDVDPRIKSSADSNTKARKRTKTGCLTCRKRRIKCGEERPICNNCIKSKRHCDGYNQRVVFKPPIGDWPAAQANPLSFHGGVGVVPGGGPRPLSGFQQPYPGSAPPRVPYTSQYPRQEPQYAFAQPQHSHFSVENVPGRTVAGTYPPEASPGYVPSPTPYGQHQVDQSYPAPYSMAPMPADYTHVSPQMPRAASQGHRQQPVQLPYHSPEPLEQTHHGYQHVAMPLNVGGVQAAQQNHHHYSQAYQFPAQTSAAESYKPAQMLSESEQDQVMQAAEQDVLVWQKMASCMEAGDGEPLRLMHHQQQEPGDPRQAVNVQSPATSTAHPIIEQPAPVSQAVPYSARLQHSGFAMTHASTTEILQDAAVEYEDDDYYDVQSDDEMELVSQQALVHRQQRDFEVMMQIQRDSIDDLSVRHYGTFLYTGILDRYRAEWVANPLRNPRTARVFAHFIHATGPSLSIFERRIRNASAMFTEGPVHPSQQSLWTYTLPMLALNNQGLLHAMLALASLHIAKLQDASITPSIKHYAYALKRVHHSVGHPRKRHHVTTIAACLLLAFYEVMLAEHVKWSSHLMGAKQLLVELDFADMTKLWCKQKAEEEATERQFAYEDPGLIMNQAGLDSDKCSDFPDERVVSALIGRQVRYEDYGQVYEEHARVPAMDLTHYETYQDLWWWYFRHDAFQAVISGNKLLMDYSRCSDCPPRAPIGKPDALYGTHDHSLLLLARIGDFAARDRERKVRAVEMNGGAWRPGLGMPSPSSHGGGSAHPGFNASPGQAAMPNRQGSTSNGIPTPAIPFYGMAPPSGNATMPAAFASQSTPSPASSSSSSSSPIQTQADLEAATSAALSEWTTIRAALTTYASYLGPAFAPLSPEHCTAIPTPFGPALQYRSFDIAVLWSQYHMLTIILARCHPSMPPAAIMAAAVAASQTAGPANDIGRIAAGVMPPPLPSSAPPGERAKLAELNPSIGAALIEVIMPLFFAGIQYTEHAQREWLVTHVTDIENRTGWASAGLVANGCQKVWERAGKAGRGPLWVYRREGASKDERRSGRKSDNANAVSVSSNSPRDDFDSRPSHAASRQTPPAPSVPSSSSFSSYSAHAPPQPQPPPAAASALDADATDRRFVWTNPATRVHWAMGILSGEEDVIRPPGV